MRTQALKSKVVRIGDDLLMVIEESLERNLQGVLAEKTVLLVTSKIISYCQGRVLPKQSAEDAGKEEKHRLVRAEADWYLPAAYSKYDMMLTIKEQTLTVNAGIDESNAVIEDEQGRQQQAFVLWPQQLQETANEIWQFLRRRYGVQEVGVIITDSRSFPLRWGVVGMALVSCGFQSLNDQVGKEDLFGREIKMVKVNVAEALAVAATLEMGEVAEQTPLALVSDCPMVKFMSRPPTAAELAASKIALEDDIYGPLLTAVAWQQGGRGLQSRERVND